MPVPDRRGQPRWPTRGTAADRAETGAPRRRRWPGACGLAGVTPGRHRGLAAAELHRGASSSSGPAGVWGRSPSRCTTSSARPTSTACSPSVEPKIAVLPRRAPGRRAARVSAWPGRGAGMGGRLCRVPGARRAAARGSDLAVGPVHLRLDRRAQGGAPHATGRSPTRRSRWWRHTGSRAADAVLTPAPLSHISGLLSGILIPAAAGMRVTLMERWDPERAIDIVRARAGDVHGRATDVLLVHGRRRELLEPGDRVHAAALVRGDDRQPGIRRPRPPRLSGPRSSGPTGPPRRRTSPPRPGAIRRSGPGRPTGGRWGRSSCASLDPDTGRPVAAGEPGELVLRGPELFCGYADPAQTAAAMRQGLVPHRGPGHAWTTTVG